MKEVRDLTHLTVPQQCADRVVSRDNVAMLVPHSDVIQYFKTSGYTPLSTIRNRWSSVPRDGK